MKTREEEHVAVLRVLYRALAEGKQGCAQTLLDPDIEWTEHAEELYFSGRRTGRQAVVDEVIVPRHDKITEFRFRPKKFFVVGDRVVVLGHETGRGRATAFKLNAPAAHVWTFEKGRPVRFEGFHDVLEWEVVLGTTSVQSHSLAE